MHIMKIRIWVIFLFVGTMGLGFVHAGAAQGTHPSVDAPPIRSADIVLLIDRSPSLNGVLDDVVDSAKFLMDYLEAIDPEHIYFRVAIVAFHGEPVVLRGLDPLGIDAWETVEQLRYGSVWKNTNFSGALCQTWALLRPGAVNPGMDVDQFVILFSDGQSYPYQDKPVNFFKGVQPTGFGDTECNTAIDDEEISIELPEKDRNFSRQILRWMSQNSKNGVQLYSVIYQLEERAHASVSESAIWWRGTDYIPACLEINEQGHCIEGIETSNLAAFFAKIIQTTLSTSEEVGFQAIPETGHLRIIPANRYIERILVSVILSSPVESQELKDFVLLSTEQTNEDITPNRDPGGTATGKVGEAVYDLTISTGDEAWVLTAAPGSQVWVQQIRPRFIIEVPLEEQATGSEYPVDIRLHGVGKRLPEGNLQAYLARTDQKEVLPVFVMQVIHPGLWAADITAPMEEGIYALHLLDEELDQYIARQEYDLQVFAMPVAKDIRVLPYDWETERWTIQVDMEHGERLPTEIDLQGSIKDTEGNIINFGLLPQMGILTGTVDIPINPGDYLVMVKLPKIRTVDGVIYWGDPNPLLHPFYETPAITDIQIENAENKITLSISRLFNFDDLKILLTYSDANDVPPPIVIKLECDNFTNKPVFETACQGEIPAFDHQVEVSSATLSGKLASGDEIQLTDEYMFERGIMIGTPQIILTSPTPSIDWRKWGIFVGGLFALILFIIISLLGSFATLKYPFLTGEDRLRQKNRIRSKVPDFLIWVSSIPYLWFSQIQIKKAFATGKPNWNDHHLIKQFVGVFDLLEMRIYQEQVLTRLVEDVLDIGINNHSQGNTRDFLSEVGQSLLQSQASSVLTEIAWKISAKHINTKKRKQQDDQKITEFIKKVHKYFPSNTLSSGYAFLEGLLHKLDNRSEVRRDTIDGIERALAGYYAYHTYRDSINGLNIPWNYNWFNGDVLHYMWGGALDNGEYSELEKETMNVLDFPTLELVKTELALRELASAKEHLLNIHNVELIDQFWVIDFEIGRDFDVYGRKQNTLGWLHWQCYLVDDQGTRMSVQNTKNIRVCQLTSDGLDFDYEMGRPIRGHVFRICIDKKEFPQAISWEIEISAIPRDILSEYLVEVSERGVSIDSEHKRSEPDSVWMRKRVMETLWGTLQIAETGAWWIDELKKRLLEESSGSQHDLKRPSDEVKDALDRMMLLPAAPDNERLIASILLLSSNENDEILKQKLVDLYAQAQIDSKYELENFIQGLNVRKGRLSRLEVDEVKKDDRQFLEVLQSKDVGLLIPETEDWDQGQSFRLTKALQLLKKGIG